MVLGIKEGLVECTTVCVKSVVILTYTNTNPCNSILTYVEGEALPMHISLDLIESHTWHSVTRLRYADLNYINAVVTEFLTL